MTGQDLSTNNYNNHQSPNYTNNIIRGEFDEKLLFQNKGFEFGSAQKASIVLVKRIIPDICDTFDSRILNRLTQIFIEVIQADRKNPRGNRQITSEHLNILTGFDFNLARQLGSVLFAKYSLIQNEKTKFYQINFKPFIPSNFLATPKECTHFKIVAYAVPLLPIYITQHVAIDQSKIIKWNKKPTQEISLILAQQLQQNTAKAIIIGVIFYQKTNGILFELQQGSQNSYCITHILTKN